VRVARLLCFLDACAWPDNEGLRTLAAADVWDRHHRTQQAKAERMYNTLFEGNGPGKSQPAPGAYVDMLNEVRRHRFIAPPKPPKEVRREGGINYRPGKKKEASERAEAAEEEDIGGSVWPPRLSWCDGTSLVDDDEVLRKRFENDWRRALRLGVARLILTHADDDLDEDDRDDGMLHQEVADTVAPSPHPDAHHGRVRSAALPCSPPCAAPARRPVCSRALSPSPGRPAGVRATLGGADAARDAACCVLRRATLGCADVARDAVCCVLCAVCRRLCCGSTAPCGRSSLRTTPRVRPAASLLTTLPTCTHRISRPPRRLMLHSARAAQRAATALAQPTPRHGHACACQHVGSRVYVRARYVLRVACCVLRAVCVPLVCCWRGVRSRCVVWRAPPCAPACQLIQLMAHLHPRGPSRHVEGRRPLLEGRLRPALCRHQRTLRRARCAAQAAACRPTTLDEARVGRSPGRLQRGPAHQSRARECECGGGGTQRRGRAPQADGFFRRRGGRQPSCW
jgi:hypothetical protein